MRRTFLVSLLIVCGGSPVAGSEDEFQSPELKALGKRFVVSLRDDNIVAYSQCWLSGSAMVEVEERDRGAVLTEGKQVRLMAYALKRDRQIAAVFRPMLAELAKVGPVRQRWTLHSISAHRVKEHRDADGNIMHFSSHVTILLRVNDDTLVRIRIDDASEVGGKWLFVDRPDDDIRIIKDDAPNEFRKVELDIQATETDTRPPLDSPKTENGTGR